MKVPIKFTAPLEGVKLITEGNLIQTNKGQAWKEGRFFISVVPGRYPQAIETTHNNANEAVLALTK